MNFNNPNIIKYERYYYINIQNPTIEDFPLPHNLITHYCLVMEFAGKELKLNNFNGIYNENRVLEIFVQILLGFKYLHDQNIAHCNLTLKVYLLLF
jgi:serine/threonine protein kinase